MEGPFLQFGLAPAEEGDESSGDLPRGVRHYCIPTGERLSSVFCGGDRDFWYMCGECRYGLGSSVGGG